MDKGGVLYLDLEQLTHHSEWSEESEVAPDKNRNQGSTSQSKTAVNQAFRPLATLGVTAIGKRALTCKKDFRPFTLFRVTATGP